MPAAPAPIIVTVVWIRRGLVSVLLEDTDGSSYLSAVGAPTVVVDARIKPHAGARGKEIYNYYTSRVEIYICCVFASAK